MAYSLTQHFSLTFVMYPLLILSDSVIYFSISKVSVILALLIKVNGVSYDAFCNNNRNHYSILQEQLCLINRSLNF